MNFRRLVSTASFFMPLLFVSGQNHAAVNTPSRLLVPFAFEDAQALLTTLHDVSGNWRCGYVLAADQKEPRPDARVMLAEIDEEFLYMNIGDGVLELRLVERKGDESEYASPRGSDRWVTLKVVKRSSPSEYETSHDREVRAVVRVDDEVEELVLFGESCGV
ncbi:hypothetical protein KRR23_22990 [Pseudomonas sp. CVAP|uniref:hypothetical protein n=1 Tax=Pseudomonas sp. CVAP\|nr:hypothetical protein [Pseudomonas sp. CVAP\